MTQFRTSLFAAALVAATAGDALAKPPSPVALERRIAESDLIVVGALKTQPVHCGDAYEVTVEEALKGSASGQIHVKSPYYFDGCIEYEGKPQPKSREAGAKRALFFCDAAKDGVRDTSAVVTLEPDDGMSATLWIGVFARYKASHGPEAVKTLVALDDERAGADRAVTVWIRGLASDNPILVEALLDRYRIVSGDDAARRECGSRFGDAVVRRAARDAAASPKELLVAVLAHAADKLPPHRSAALCRAAEAYERSPAEDRPLFDKAIAAARASARDGENDVRNAALWLLVAADTDDAVGALNDALLRNEPFERFSTTWGVELAHRLSKKSAARKDEVIAMFVALLDSRPDGHAWLMEALKKLTGLGLSDAATWKSWWAARKK